MRFYHRKIFSIKVILLVKPPHLHDKTPYKKKQTRELVAVENRCPERVSKFFCGGSFFKKIAPTKHTHPTVKCSRTL